MAVTLHHSAFLEAIRKHDPSSVAVVETGSGACFSYNALLQSVARAKELLLLKSGRSDASISGERIAFMVENGFDYVGMKYYVPKISFSINMTNPNLQ